MSGGMINGLSRRLGREELAFAYELRQEGIRWKLIARELGVSAWYLDARIRQCKKEGISWIRKRGA